MTLAHILSGPITDRAHDASHPVTESEARGILTQAEKQMSRKQRGQIFRKFADYPHANLSPEARAIYRAYAAEYGA
jgi:hypothetical protein